MINIINSIKIMDRINELLVNEYPDVSVYIDLVPKEFERPSFLIELITSRQTSINAKTIQETLYFTITCFDKVNEYSHSSTINLLEIQLKVLEIFRNGYMKVDDRIIEVKASSGGRNFDRAYIDLQFEYFESRTDKNEEIPKMKEVHVTIKEE